jgi:hypothetical protein
MFIFNTIEWLVGFISYIIFFPLVILLVMINPKSELVPAWIRCEDKKNKKLIFGKHRVATPRPKRKI